MFTKFISVAFVLAATLAPTSAVVFPRDNNVRDPQAGTLTPTITPTITPTTTMSTPITTSWSSTTPSTSSTPITSSTPTSSTPTTSSPTTSTTPPPSTTSSHPTTTFTHPTTIPSSIPITPTTSPTPSTSVTPTSKPSETGKPSGQPSKAPSPSVPSQSCDGVQPWQVNLAYSAGTQVIFNNQLWTANQWSYNNNPESAAAAWTLNGICNQPISNKVDCTGIPGWNKSTAYNGGSKVTFNGQLWISTQWTESNSPGDASGTWKDLGACN